MKKRIVVLLLFVTFLALGFTGSRSVSADFGDVPLPLEVEPYPGT